MSDQGFAEVQRSSRKESFDRPLRTILNWLFYLVGLVCFVYLVVVVQLVSFVNAYPVGCQMGDPMLHFGMDPRGFPTTLPEFQRVFPDDAACARYLEHLRWPHGLTCMKCGKIGEPYRFAKRRSVVLRCRACQANVSLMAGTVMMGSHTPLSVWFWGAYLVATQTPGQSALQFQRQLGMSRYETAFQMLHKLRAGMVRPERDAIGSQYPVEVDETFVGGRTKGEGYGVHHKATVVGAIEVRQWQTA